MRLITRFLVVLVGLALAATAAAQGTGRSLDIQPGARQNAMGAAGVALAGDAAGATWWNPAFLGFAKHADLQLTGAQLVPGLATDVTYNQAAYLQPIEGWGAIAGGLAFLSYGSSEGVDVSGNFTGKFDSYEFSSGLSYGTRLLPDFAIGATVKYIRIQLAPQAQQGVGATFGFDFGALYQIPAARLRIGGNLQNMGPSVVFISEDQASPLSRNVKVGAAWEAVSNKQFMLTLTSDFNQSLVTSDFRTYNHGAELLYTGQLAGRIGWYSDPLGNISDFTYGIGVNWNSLTLDWGSIPQAKDASLPNVNKVTLGYRF
jgi:hypothetical protein